MILKHRIAFLVWGLWVFLLGYRVGTILYTYSAYKEKVIKGCITGFDGVSVTDKSKAFSITIEWFEPIQGDTYPYFCKGSYTLDDVVLKLSTHFKDF